MNRVEEASVPESFRQDRGAAAAPTCLPCVADGPLARACGAPLAALVGGALVDKFHAWRGRSGQRYMFSVFPIDADMPDFDDAVVIATAVGSGAARQSLLIADTGSLPELVLRGAAMARARQRGASELHVHLLARTQAERRAVLRDLAPGASIEPGRQPSERPILEPELHEVLVRGADVIGIIA